MSYVIIMLAPICAVCLKSDVLCSGCQQKLESGKISDCDIEASRFLYGLEEKFRILQNAKLVKTLEGNSIVIIAGEGDAAKIVGRQGSVVKLLAKHFNKPIKVIEFSSNIKAFVQNLLSPAFAVVNIIYAKEGEKYKILTKERISNKEEIENIIKDIFGKPAEVVTV